MSRCMQVWHEQLCVCLMLSVMVVVVSWLLRQPSVDPGVTLNTCCSSVLSCRYIYNISLWTAEQLSLVAAATSIVFVVTKPLSQQTPLSWQTPVCCDKTRLLSQQKRACHNKKHNCVSTNICRDKHVFVVAKRIFCCDKKYACCMFVMTNMCLSWQVFVMIQLCFCHEKHAFVATKYVFCHDKRLSRETRACHNKNGTLASPASDTQQHSHTDG